MRARKVLRLWIILPLAVVGAAATAQTRPCSTVPYSEREAWRSIGACRDAAPIVDAAPSAAEPAPSAIVAVPNVIGLGFDDARNRLAGFSLRRSYRPSAEPGGTVLEQQPAPPTRLAAGAIVRLVLSDGTLRLAPRVSAAEIDGVPNPAATQTEVRPQPAVSTDGARAGRVIEQGPADAVGQSGAAAQSPAVADRAGTGWLVVPNVGGMTFGDAQARLGDFRVRRRDRPSSAPIGRVIEQVPKASARAAPASVVALVVSSGPSRRSESVLGFQVNATRVTENVELPSLIGRSYADASGALSEFKVDRAEKASDSPSGQVLAQDPAPGTSVRPGSTVSLQVSDGSLAGAAAPTPTAAAPSAVATTPPATTPDAATTSQAETTPAETTPAAAASTPDAVTTPAEVTTSAAETTAATSAAAVPAPAQNNRSLVTFPSSATLLLIAGVLVGLGLGALLTRRWFLRRQPTDDVETPVPVRAAPTEIDVGGLPVPEAAPEIKFSARLDAGETSIEIAAPSDADETAPEYSRELHE